jgi:hypothetical protein
MRYGLTDYEWVLHKPFLPNKPCGAEVAQLSNRHDHNHDDDTGNQCANPHLADTGRAPRSAEQLLDQGA